MSLGVLGAVPVQAHHGGVVLEAAACRVEDCGGQHQRGLPRVQIPGPLQQDGKVDLVSVMFEHAVGQHEQTVTGAQIDVLDAVGVG